jgi:hypothetical protein
MIFNRHSYIEDLKQYWDNTEKSNIGIGMFKRNDDFTVSKSYGRTDICLINHTDKRQYFFELNGYSNNTPQEVREIMLKEICSNMEEVLRSIHFHNWLSKQIITNMPIKECISLLQEGLDSFSFEEAIKLFPVK